MKVTCICPTGNRQHLVPMAIDSFLSQTYTDSELLVVDDGVERTVVPVHPRVRYIRINSKVPTIGDKRNLCCEEAQGQIIAHFDDDDWSHPLRIEEQVERLKTTGASLTGYDTLAYYDVPTGKTYKYINSLNQKYATGTSMCYYKFFWNLIRFDSVNLEEDLRFNRRAKAAGALDSTCGAHRIVVRRHPKNTWAANCNVYHNDKDFHSVGLGELPVEFTRLLA